MEVSLAVKTDYSLSRGPQTTSVQKSISQKNSVSKLKPVPVYWYGSDMTPNMVKETRTQYHRKHRGTRGRGIVKISKEILWGGSSDKTKEVTGPRVTEIIYLFDVLLIEKFPRVCFELSIKVCHLNVISLSVLGASLLLSKQGFYPIFTELGPNLERVVQAKYIMSFKSVKQRQHVRRTS